VLIGLQKFAEQFLFLEIKNVAGFKALLRRKIAPALPRHEWSRSGRGVCESTTHAPLNPIPS
jgi:hypothetical protein